MPSKFCQINLSTSQNFRTSQNLSKIPNNFNDPMRDKIPRNVDRVLHNKVSGRPLALTVRPIETLYKPTTNKNISYP
jgi:hypothetical protein